MPGVSRGLWAALTAVAVSLTVAAAPARADGVLYAPFDAAALRPAEIRLLQTALAAGGDYDGPLDGAWGRPGASALAAYAQREFDDSPRNLHAGSLVVDFLAEIDARGWTVRALPGLGVSMALPERALTSPEDEQAGRRWWSVAGSLTLLAHSFGFEEARAWHAAARDANADPGALATDAGVDVMRTTGRLQDGRRFFTRSDRTGSHWATVFIASGADELALMNVMRASIRTGAPLNWQLPPGGRLEALVIDALALAERIDGGVDIAGLDDDDDAGTAPRAMRLTDGEGGIAASGTGFFVGEGVLVTAAHVVAGCRAVGLGDGTRLTVLAEDAGLDVAALAVPQRAGPALPLAPAAPARLGQRVHALGYPYYAIAGTALHLTGGNVSALSGVNDDARFFSFTAPVQPGSSGGPLIGPLGQVLGVVVSRLSERYIAEATGTLPQNVNYALRTDELVAFLARHGVVLPASGPDGTDMADIVAEGVPATVADAVVPVLCL